MLLKLNYPERNVGLNSPSAILPNPEEFTHLDITVKKLYSTKDYQLLFLVKTVSGAFIKVAIHYSKQVDAKRQAKKLESILSIPVRDANELLAHVEAYLSSGKTVDRPGQFMIPTAGQLITLLKPWTFNLPYEYRNDSFYRELMPSIGPSKAPGTLPALSVTLPKNCKLKVERLYIRNGAPGFDSLTFRLQENHPYTSKHRFWVTLEDANNIYCTLHGQ